MMRATVQPASCFTFSGLALTSGLALINASVSHAAVVATLINSITLPSDVSSNSLQFNLTTGEVSLNNSLTTPQFTVDYLFNNTTKPSLHGLFNQPGAVLYADPDFGAYVVNNSPGTLIQAGSGTFGDGTNWLPYLSDNQNSFSQFHYGMSGYAGLRIPDPSNSDQLDYGYAAITINPDNSVTLSRLAYENTGAPIATGAIPEPSTLALCLLALGGSMGAVTVRQRRLAKS